MPRRSRKASTTEKKSIQIILPRPSLEQVRLKSQHFLNRELSWLEFNHRVLFQAQDHRNPLLERLKFCQIFVTNLDEFFMKRVGGLKNQVVSVQSFMSIDGKSPQEQLLVIRAKINEQVKLLGQIFEKEIRPELDSEGIQLLTWKNLTADEQRILEENFMKKLFPILTPLAVDPGHPFPFISNLSSNLGVSMRRPNEEEKHFARLKIPTEIDQWIRLPGGDEDSYRFISSDELIKNCLHHLFPGMILENVTLFRVTRNANLSEDDEDVEDLLEFIEAELRERRFAPVLRLEHEKSPDPWSLNFLCDELEISEQDVMEMPSIICHTNFNAIYNVERPDLKYRAFKPVVPHEFLEEKANIFHLLKKKDYLIHHPYESFAGTVEHMIRDASLDPKVLAIKMTLYRIGPQGNIVEALIRAAEQGKHVAVLIELKARFDEQRNIYLAQKLEANGVHVAYGMVGLKTHSKMCMVVREDYDGITSYAHVGTGNYNATTANFYTDISLLTSNPAITSEIIEAFNYLTGISLKKDYHSLLVAPLNMKARFIAMVKEEGEHAKAGRPAHIVAKMNSLEDVEIINELYDASRAGVKIDLIIRGFCCLRPGVSGISENIRVVSIIGRYLEHSRIFYFRSGAADELQGRFYIGSADWMFRNLNSRVEVVTPILAKELKEKLWRLFSLSLKEKALSWELQSGGQYTKLVPAENVSGLHDIFMSLAKDSP